MGHRRKTRQGRLSQLDDLLLVLGADLLDDARFDGLPVVDLGIGARPWTTEELHARLRESGRSIEVVGVDLAEDVVARAQEHARPGLSFVQGGFDLPLAARLVRVMNVLRDLSGPEVAAIHERISARVAEGGVILEGSCGPTGEVGVAHWLVVADGVRRDGMLFWLDETRGTAPILFRDRLPRDVHDDRTHPVFALLQRWNRAHAAVDAGARRLERSVLALDEPGLEVVGPGAALWRPSGGVAPAQFDGLSASTQPT